MSTCSREEFIRDYAIQIQNQSASLFIGSGLSRQAGYTDWKGLLKEVAEDIGLNVDKEHDLISLAEYYVNAKRNRVKIDNAISQYFGEEKTPTDTHYILASLPIRNYWTTNYDKLLEKTFSESNLSYSFLTDDTSFRKYINGNGIVLHKLHGDVDAPQDAVITKTDYDEFAFKHEILLSKLKGEMCSNTFLFLGYSFSDTDINHILTRIRLFYKGKPARSHYCIQETIKRGLNSNGKPETDEELEYRKRKQEHHIVNLQTYGIQTVLVEDYSIDIPQILKEVREIVYKKHVFISGACEDSDPQINTYQHYAQTISTWLIANNYKIYSGYGKNIGAAVVAGVHDGCKVNRRQPIKQFNEQLFVYPFPYKSMIGKEEKKQIYTELRRNTINKTKIVIIINGTKKFQRKNVIADGIMEEFNVAKEMNCLIIPIAVTGGAAAEIWEIMKKSDSAYANSKEFNILKYGKNFDEVYNAVLAIIGQN